MVLNKTLRYLRLFIEFKRIFLVFTCILIFVWVYFDVASVFMLNILEHVIIQMAHQFYTGFLTVIIDGHSTINSVYLQFIFKMFMYKRPIQLLEVLHVLLDQLDLVFLVQNLPNHALVMRYFHNSLIEHILWHALRIRESREGNATPQVSLLVVGPDWVLLLVGSY